MNLQESSQILTLLQSCYPNTYSGFNTDQLCNVAKIWADLFQDIPFGAVQEAVREYIMSNTTGFGPDPGQLAAIINRNVRADDERELDKYEAWNLVVKTMKSGLAYDGLEKFKALPEKVQKAVGNASNLRQWSIMESGIEYVKRDFMHDYERLQQDEEDRKGKYLYTLERFSDPRYLTE